MTCTYCGGPIYEDQSLSVLRHADYDNIDGDDLDADHTARDDSNDDDPFYGDRHYDEEPGARELDDIANGSHAPDSDLFIF